MSARSRRLKESLGSSWGDADYASEEASSVRSANSSASEVEWEDSNREVEKQRRPHVAPLPTPRTKRTTLSQPISPSQTRSAPPRKSANKISTRQSHTLEPSRTRTRATKSLHRTREEEEQSEPRFIVPTMDDITHRNMDNHQQYDPRQARQRTRNQPALQRPAGAEETRRARRQADHARERDRVRIEEERGPWYYVHWVLQTFLFPILEDIFRTLGWAINHFIRPIMGVLLGVGIIVFGLQAATGLLRSSLNIALLAPVCALPGSTIFIPACRTEPSTSSPHANFEDLVTVQHGFEDVVEATKDVHTLPAEMKTAELAMRDLRTLVKHSRLPSRHELDNEFQNFILTAKEVSHDLSRFHVRIGTSMDRIIANNKITMNTLRGIDAEASTGAFKYVADALTGSFATPAPSLQSRIYEAYLLHISRNKDDIDALISMAQNILWVLTVLDERLSTIHSIATADDQTITAKQEELLASLWTKLGGNKRDRAANASSLHLLQSINTYRKKALKHVSQMLVQLQENQAQLESLREGVAAPELEGADAAAIEFHIEVIGRGVERLQNTRREMHQREVRSYLAAVRGGEYAEERREIDVPKPKVVTVKAG